MERMREKERERGDTNLASTARRLRTALITDESRLTTPAVTKKHARKDHFQNMSDYCKGHERHVVCAKKWTRQQRKTTARIRNSRGSHDRPRHKFMVVI